MHSTRDDWRGERDRPSGPIARLYDRCGHLVLRRCVAMLRDQEEALDVTQWTFLRAIEVGFEVRSTGEALAWLYQTATRRCLTLLRDAGNRRRLRATHAELMAALPAPSAEREVVDRDVLRKVLQLVDERVGEVALLSHVQGLPAERVAEICGTSVRTVKRDRKRFSEALAAVTREER